MSGDGPCGTGRGTGRGVDEVVEAEGAQLRMQRTNSWKETQKAVFGSYLNVLQQA